MLVIRGRVEEWRVQRNFTYLLYALHFESKDRTSITEALPLPFDDELVEQLKIMSDEEIRRTELEYAEVVRLWGEEDPFKKQ